MQNNGKITKSKGKSPAQSANSSTDNVPRQDPKTVDEAVPNPTVERDVLPAAKHTNPVTKTEKPPVKAPVVEISENLHPVLAESRRLLEDQAWSEASKLAVLRGVPVDVYDVGSGSGGFFRGLARLTGKSKSLYRGIASVRFLSPVLSPDDVVRASKLPADPSEYFCSRVRAAGGDARFSADLCQCTLGECSHIKPLEDGGSVGFGSLGFRRQRVFIFTHSAYYMGETDLAHLREDDVLFIIAHEFEGDNGVLPTESSGKKPEFLWRRRNDGTIFMRSLDKFACGTVYSHPDITKWLSSRKIPTIFCNAYGVQERCCFGVASLYRFVCSKHDFNGVEWEEGPEETNLKLRKQALSLATRQTFVATPEARMNAACGNISTLTRNFPETPYEEVVDHVREAYALAYKVQQELLVTLVENQNHNSYHRKVLDLVNADSLATSATSAVMNIPLPTALEGYRNTAAKAMLRVGTLACMGVPTAHDRAPVGGK